MAPIVGGKWKKKFTQWIPKPLFTRHLSFLFLFLYLSRSLSQVKETRTQLSHSLFFSCLSLSLIPLMHTSFGHELRAGNLSLWLSHSLFLPPFIFSHISLLSDFDSLSSSSMQVVSDCRWFLSGGAFSLCNSLSLSCSQYWGCLPRFGLILLG